MAIQMETDEIDEYLRQVFVDIDPKESLAGAQAYRSGVDLMRKDMEDRLRASVAGKEETGLSHDEAVRQTLAGLTNPLEIRRQVVKEAIIYSDRLDAAVKEANRPLWDRTVENVWLTPVLFVYIALYWCLPRGWTSQIIVANALGIIPFLIAVWGSAYFTLRGSNRPKKYDALFAIYFFIWVIWIGCHPAGSVIRLAGLGPYCVLVGNYLGTMIGYEMRRRKYVVKGAR